MAQPSSDSFFPESSAGHSNEIDERTLKRSKCRYEVNPPPPPPPATMPPVVRQTPVYAKYPDFYAAPTYFDFYGSSGPVPIAVTPAMPSHQLHHASTSSRRSPFQSLKFRQDIAWIIIIFQTIFIVALSLLFFAYVLFNTYQPKPNNSEISSITATEPSIRSTIVMRKMPRHDFGDNSVEESSNHIDEYFEEAKIPTTTSAEHIPFKSAAVISNDRRCSDIGNAVLVRGGNAADAAIATVFCLGVRQPQASGLGGGLLAVFCDAEGHCTDVNARETAPAAASKDMFIANPRDSSEGYRAIAVPGELSGLWRMYERFGSRKIPWHDLVKPAADLARKGVVVGAELAAAIEANRKTLMDNDNIRAQFINPLTVELFREGDVMERDRLADTLQSIAEAEEPLEYFYREELSDIMIKEIRKGGGIITKLDLEDYEAVLSPALCSILQQSVVLCGARPPSSFIVTQLIVAAMHALYPANYSDEDLRSEQFYHRFIEATKFAFAQRVALGDPVFTLNSEYTMNLLLNSTFISWIASRIPEQAQEFRYYGTPYLIQQDHGTSHVSVIDEFGNSIAVSSSINNAFGAMRASKLGFLYNSQMDSFSTPNVPSEFGFLPSEANFIQPGKCPMSSLTPIIALEKTNHKPLLSAGGIGGTRIIPAIASLLTRALIFERSLAESAAQKLIFSQYVPDNAFFENGFDKTLLHQLADRGHQVRPLPDNKFAVFGVSRTRRSFLQTTNDARARDAGASGY